ncbi:MAG: threonine/serine exporter [Ruminococcaceae bacterium]|nr:threonine/serine exporter [Oscillospiraceae bacterium]
MNDFLRICVLVVATVIGVGGVALMFGVEKKHIMWGVLSAVICCVAYEVSLLLLWPLFVASLVGSAVTAVYSYIMARVFKIPATFMIILGILPLVPGARLYYTMLGLVNSDMDMFYYYGQTALLIAAGLAVGIIAVTALFRPINAAIKASKKAG